MRRFTGMGSWVAAFAVALVGVASTARADKWYFESSMSQDQTVPPTGSEATGHATFVYDDETNMISGEIMFEGIAHEDFIYAHLHVGRVGFYGDMVVHLGHQHEFEHDHETGEHHRIVPEQFVDPIYEFDLLTDGCYVAVHSVQFESAGEIRGQTIAIPRLSHTGLARGQDATLQVSGALGGETVHFLYSWDGVGFGPSVPQLGGLTLDVLNPVRMLGSATATARGTATLTVRVPQNIMPFPIAFQAVIRRGPGGSESVKSNTSTTAILPNCCLD